MPGNEIKIGVLSGVPRPGNNQSRSSDQHISGKQEIHLFISPPVDPGFAEDLRNLSKIHPTSRYFM